MTIGTPRQNSMKMVDRRRMTGSSERRPSAMTMPSGTASTPA